MRAVIVDPRLARELIARRRALGLDRWDEVWNGEWHMNPSPSTEHQRIEKALLHILLEVVEDAGLGQVFHQLNVADPDRGLEDFRIPDISVVLRESAVKIAPDFISGGPDFLIEIHSPGDETYEKIPWYARQGVKELLIVDRDSKRMELYRHDGQELRLIGASPGRLESRVLPLRFETVEQREGGRLRLSHSADPARSWLV